MKKTFEKLRWTVDAFFGPPVHKTISEARKRLVEEMKVGTDDTYCDCCRQKVRIYPRKITGTMFRALRMIDQRGGVIEPHVLNKFCGGGDAAKLRLWGFIHSEPYEQNGKSSSRWHITRWGRMFLTDPTFTVPRYIAVWDGRRVGESIDTITNAEVTEFDLNELHDPTLIKETTWTQ